MHGEGVGVDGDVGMTLFAVCCLRCCLLLCCVMFLCEILKGSPTSFFVTPQRSFLKKGTLWYSQFWAHLRCVTPRRMMYSCLLMDVMILTLVMASLLPFLVQICTDARFIRNSWSAT